MILEETPGGCSNMTEDPPCINIMNLKLGPEVRDDPKWAADIASEKSFSFWDKISDLEKAASWTISLTLIRKGTLPQRK